MLKALIPFATTLLVAAAAACSAPPRSDRCPELPDPGPDAVVVDLPVALVADDEPYALGESTRTHGNAELSVSKLKLYVSDVELRTADGGHAHAQLLDGSSGDALPFGVALLDAERASSLALRMRAPAGEYQGLSLTIGVPPTCSDGETVINHADASTMAAPLDVDSDMYWSWDPGYVFFKVEGRVQDEGSKPFFYHVGDDSRLMRVDVDGPFVIGADGAVDARLAADILRLFVTPTGDNQPAVDGDDDDRASHGGPLADQMKQNIEGSAFLRMEGGAQ